MFMLFLLGLRAIHINIIKIQNCPPKDIFKKFKRKADNHSTLVEMAGFISNPIKMKIYVLSSTL